MKIGKRLAVRARTARCEIGATPNSSLEIGARVFINQGASIVAANRIEIGDDSRIGDFVAIYDSNYHQIDPNHPVRCAPVIIGVNVWLGRNVLVLPGSKIGDHAVVAAGSVVRSDIPSCVLAEGNPAKVVRELQIPSGWRRELSGSIYCGKHAEAYLLKHPTFTLYKRSLEGLAINDGIWERGLSWGRSRRA